MPNFGRYNINQRLFMLGKTKKWLRDEVAKKGYDVKLPHFCNFVNGKEQGDRADKVCEVASDILKEYEK